MIPDYSMELCFSTGCRALAQSRVAGLCDRESAEIVRGLAFGDDTLNVEICLMAPPDALQEMLGDLPLENGVARCGVIDLEYSPSSQYTTIPGSFSLELWPRTRRLQYILFASMAFRSQITELLAECGGTWGAIVFESCYPIEFWSPAEGRHNDDRPERLDGKLLVPSELNSLEA